MGYKKIAAQGIGLMGSLHVLTKGFAVVKIAILARLLSPYDLGVYGISTLILSLFETFSDISLGTFLIQIQKKIDGYVGSVFIIQIVRGVVLFLIILLSSPLISGFFNDKSLISILIIISLVPLIKSLENPFIVLFQKNLFFEKEFVIRAVANTFDLVVVIIAAFIYRSIVGVVFGLIASSLIYVILSWIFINQKPTIKSYSRKKILEIIHFAKSISVLGAATFAVMRIDSFLIGKFAGLATLGGYQFAQKISFEIMNDTSAIVGKVTFPVYSKISKDKIRLRRAFNRSFLSIVIFEGVFAMLVLLFSRQIILLIAGPEWLKYASYLKLLVIYGFLLSTWGSIGSLFMSLAKQSKLVLLTILRLVILAPLLYVASDLKSVEFVIISLIVSLVLIFPPTYFLIRRYLH